MIGRRPARALRRADHAPRAAQPGDPERLDVLVPLAPARSWAAVLGLAAAMAVSGGYAWAARVNTTVRVPGILLAGDRPGFVAAPVDGSVARVLVRSGAPVAAGDLVAVLDDAAGRQTEVRAAEDGTVAAVIAPGSAVHAGARLATVDRTGRPLSAVLFADPAGGALLRPGEPVDVAGPGAVAAGVVSAVDAYPSDPAEIRALLGTDSIPDAPAGATRLVTVSFPGVTARPGESYVPVGAVVTVGSRRVVDTLLPGSRS